MRRISELFGNEENRDSSLVNEAMFRTRCAIPGVVQSYNSNANTAEIQPAIRERIVKEDGTIEYVNLPLLINVPVVFPQAVGIGITFPIKKNDEVLVVFSDLAIDNFWEKGSVQNPIEVRRHDLSDGIAIPCLLSQKNKSTSSDLTMKNNPCSIKITNEDISLTTPSGSFSFNNFLQWKQEVDSHTHGFSYIDTNGTITYDRTGTTDGPNEI